VIAAAAAFTLCLFAASCVVALAMALIWLCMVVIEAASKKEIKN
jgi:hypothetical protein